MDMPQKGTSLKSKWGHIFGTTGPIKMVHLSKFVEFYRRISQNIFVKVFLNSYFKYILSCASEAGSPTNCLGSGQRRDTDLGLSACEKHKTYAKYLDKVYIMTDYLKLKNTGHHWTCFTKEL